MSYNLLDVYCKNAIKEKKDLYVSVGSFHLNGMAHFIKKTFEEAQIPAENLIVKNNTKFYENMSPKERLDTIIEKLIKVGRLHLKEKSSLAIRK
jgi:hypothetical protein